MASTTTLKLDPEMKDRIKRLAEGRRRTSHWVMRESISEYVIREEQRDKFLKEAIKSWESYQETGLHLTGSEVSEWLKTWGSEQETDAPECHK